MKKHPLCDSGVHDLKVFKLEEQGYNIQTGIVLSNEEGSRVIVDCGAVRYLDKTKFWDLIHSSFSPVPDVPSDVAEEVADEQIDAAIDRHATNSKRLFEELPEKDKVCIRQLIETY